MKRIILSTFFFIYLLAGQSQTKNFLDQSYLEVTGSADTLVTPNEIFIKIIISEKDTKDRTSVEDLEIKMVNMLRVEGLDIDKSLSTSDITSNFKTYLLRSKDVIKSKQYILKVRDALTASKVFIQLEELEISNTSIDRVHHSGLENIRNSMRTNAVVTARTRAIALLKPLGQSLGPAILVSDNETHDISRQLQGSMEGVVVMGYSPKNKQSAELPKIEFEKIKVTTTVSVKFILK